MAIQKQEFYEGAALYQLLRGSLAPVVVSYEAPFFVLNGKIRIYLKYSTAKRSPWGFSFAAEEQAMLMAQRGAMGLFIGLVCGADGIATISYDSYAKVAALRDVALRISCRRNHREHFEVSGPDGVMPGKVAPSEWTKLIQGMGAVI